MREYLLVCKCSGRAEKAQTAYQIKFPETPIPPVVKGHNEIYKLALELKNEHIKAISRIGGQFSYYIKVDESGKILEEYDLITGRRTA